MARSTIIGTFCGSLRIRQTDNDPIDRRHTVVDVRRVTTDREGEHVQIGMTVGKTGKTRVSEQYYTLILKPEQIDILVTALTKLHPKYDGVYRSMAEDRKRYAKFYGLKAEEVTT